MILNVSKAYQCHFAVLAGGTSPFRHASNSEGGITIDMRRMKSVQLIDEDLLHVKVGAGAVWADVYRELDQRNMSATGTRNSLTGVTGSVLGGISSIHVYQSSSLTQIIKVASPSFHSVTAGHVTPSFLSKLYL